VERGLLAHLCRCTGWRSIVDAAVIAGGPPDPLDSSPPPGPGARRSAEAARARAVVEGGTAQEWGPAVVLGAAPFADDTAPEGCLVAVPRAGTRRSDLVDPSAWAIGATLAEARAGAGRVPGRRSGQPLEWPVPVPEGDWDVTLQTTWVEPAYLEPDASWCRPGGQPWPAAANGGAFGGKADSPAPAAARMLADHHGVAVRVVLSREDVVRLSAKRPPAAGGARSGGGGEVHLLAPVGAPVLGGEVHLLAPGGGPAPAGGIRLIGVGARPDRPAVSLALRGAGWAEAAVLAAAAEVLGASGATPAGPGRPGTARAHAGAPGGGRAEASVRVGPAGWPESVDVEVDAGDPLDEVVLRSYVQGAAHMALGWVCTEGLALGADGLPADLTIRSFGVLRATDTPPVRVSVQPSVRPAVPVADAAFAAVAAAIWLAQGLPSRWPTMRGERR
jgi:xanthine dehydrogenase small subunit